MRGTRTHPAGFTGLNAASYIITWENWILRPESHRHGLLYERSALLALPRRNETGAPARTCTSNLRLRTATCTALTPRELVKAFASCRCRPGPCGLEDRHAHCYINDAGLVAEFGIAPNSPRLQRGANLSQLFSRKMVPPRGNAPRSISNRLMALLLSYGGYCYKKSPVKVTLPRLPGVGRARYYYTNGRKVVTASGLSPDRTELRTRVREMLCICGGCDGNWRSTRESHSGRF